MESAPSPEPSVTVTAAVHATDFTVDPSAEATATNFQTLAGALAAAPAGTSVDPTVIELAPGRYKEYQTVTKPYTILRRRHRDASAVVITGNRASGEPTGQIVDGIPRDVRHLWQRQLRDHRVERATRKNLTVENDYVEGKYLNGQAVALRTTGDRLTLDNVRLLGNQDTFYVNSATRTSISRVYVTNSFIEGDVDFIFGRATVVIDRSHTPRHPITAPTPTVHSPQPARR